MDRDDDDDYDYSDEGEPDNDGRQRTPAEWAEKRKKDKAARKLQKERDEARREAAFLRAGIDPDDKRMSYFVRGYDGEPDPEKIRAAAIDAGFLTADNNQQQADQGSTDGQDTGQQQVVDGGQSAPDPAVERIDAVVAGAGSDDPSQEAAAAKLQQAMAEGGPEALRRAAEEMGAVFAD